MKGITSHERKGDFATTSMISRPRIELMLIEKRESSNAIADQGSEKIRMRMNALPIPKPSAKT